MKQSAQPTVPLNCHEALGLGYSKIKSEANTQNYIYTITNGEWYLIETSMYILSIYNTYMMFIIYYISVFPEIQNFIYIYNIYYIYIYMLYIYIYIYIYIMFLVLLCCLITRRLNLVVATKQPRDLSISR